ncbi:MAG: cobyrinate a,c-diamide synthase [Actinomycetota bacterium]|nr:cobyrinate a,c-diamide synthase [Actinomycetota bacterium]
MIAGVSSGVGKTTITAGLMRLLTVRAGLSVGAAKVGPDFIDPGYHQIATGHRSRNLDAFLSGTTLLGPIAARAGDGHDVLVIEGVMGLFDGALLEGAPPTSTAAVAKALRAPVVLVIDAARTSTSAAAVAKGFVAFDPEVQVAGVIVNNVASPSHAGAVRMALQDAGITVFGMVPRDPGMHFASRHLGLIPVVEDPGAVSGHLDRVAEVLADSLDAEALLRLARSAPAMSVTDAEVERAGTRARIGLVGGAAFDFVYVDNLEALQAAGAELVNLDPLADDGIPAGLDGLYLPGGFPEVFAGAIGERARWRESLGRLVEQGVPTWAECGGYMLLAQSLDGVPMAGAIAARAAMTERLTLGYAEALLRRDSVLAPAGSRLRGHEFHYSAMEPPGDALALRTRSGLRTDGHLSATLFASYLHLHLAGTPEIAQRFVTAAARRRHHREGRRGA